MTGRRLWIHAVALWSLPLIVAACGIGLLSTALIVLVLLLWRWAISLSVFVAPARCPELELETISASHYVEKVRWSMDRLGVEYTEKPKAGALGAFFLGRTVPRLFMRTGAVRSSLGNSSEILRYLWGRYAAERPEQARFLEPTPERLALEQRIDRNGVDLQVWVYYHLLPDHELTLHAWGVNNPAIPSWQRTVLRIQRPILSFLMRKSFRITDKHYAKAVEHVEDTLKYIEGELQDGRKSILGGDEVNYTDITFCAIMGLWNRPRGYLGTAGEAVAIAEEDMADAAQLQIKTWKERYPLCDRFIAFHYQQRQESSIENQDQPGHGV